MISIFYWGKNLEKKFRRGGNDLIYGEGENVGED